MKTKTLKKKLRKRSVEAYACSCGTPQDCMDFCMGDYYAMEIGIQYQSITLARNRG